MKQNYLAGKFNDRILAELKLLLIPGRSAFGTNKITSTPLKTVV